MFHEWHFDCTTHLYVCVRCNASAFQISCESVEGCPGQEPWISATEMDVALAKKEAREERIYWYETKLQSLGDELIRVRLERDEAKIDLAIAQTEIARLRAKLRDQEPQPSPRPHYRWGLLP